MTRMQKLILIAALAVCIALQYWPVKAADTIESEKIAKLDAYMACMVGRASISLYADYSSKGLIEARRYANVECKNLESAMHSLSETSQGEVNGQILVMVQAMVAGMRQMHVNPESNEHEPSEDKGGKNETAIEL